MNDIWVNIQNYPEIEGNIEISVDEKSVIHIIADPEGFRSLAKICNWLADYNQDSDTNLPNGARKHIHLDPCSDDSEYGELTKFSNYAEICRLDAKGSGEFPKYYYK